MSLFCHLNPRTSRGLGLDERLRFFFVNNLRKKQWIAMKLSVHLVHLVHLQYKHH